MKPSLTAGIEHETKKTVTKEMVPPHIPAAVISTPSMIQLIEMTCMQNAQRHLDSNETTVGTHVCVSHLGPAYVGEEVTVKSRLQEVNKRRLKFEIEVHSPRGPISNGTHERAVIDLSKFGNQQQQQQ